MADAVVYFSAFLGEARMAVLTNRDVVVLIAAYNEAGRIRETVSRVRQKGYPVIVVDDGSSDGTAAAVRGMDGTEVLVSGQNEGKGASLRKGMARFLERQEAVLLLMDADGQHDPEDIGAFVDLLGSGQADLVVGNRMHHPQDMPWIRRVTNRLMSGLLSFLTRLGIPDTQCGFRAVRREALSLMNLQTSRFEIESEILLEAGRLGLKVQSVPIRSVYENHASRISPVKDTVRFISFLVRYGMRARRSQKKVRIVAQKN